MMNKLMTNFVEVVIAVEKMMTEARDAYEAERKRQEEEFIRR